MVKTTILLRDDIYEHLVKKVGRRRISETVNEILEQQLLRPKKSMFGADPWITTEDLRDEEEAHEGL